MRMMMKPIGKTLVSIFGYLVVEEMLRSCITMLHSYLVKRTIIMRLSQFIGIKMEHKSLLKQLQ